MSARVLRYGSIDSTNAEAQRLAAEGERGPLWIVADSQSAGRGRLGRAWVSEPGNLYTTLLFTFEGPAGIASQLSFVAGLAVFEAAARLLGGADGLALKWPNDVLLGGRKCCGILSETVLSGGGAAAAAIGIGLNLAHAPEGTPYPVTFLGGRHAPEAALGALQDAMAEELAVWDAGRGFAATRARWFARSAGRDGAIRVELHGELRRGRFGGIAEDGALIFAGASGEVVHIHAGDVRFDELDALRAAS